MWYVYFLQLNNGDIYVGSTNHLKRRFSSHQAGQVLSTKRNLPVKLKSYVAVETEVLARELERYFKSGSGKAFANKRFWESSGLEGKKESTTPSSLPQTKAQEARMSETRFPAGWDEERVRRVLAHYEQQSSEEAVAEDEAAFENQDDTVIKVPHELVSAVRELIARHQG
jgi:predicted GIY-YIG superfamily endonuclease